MAKAKLHFPAQASAAASHNYNDHHNPLLLPQKSLEDLSVHIQLSLAKVLLPRLCRYCRPACQRKIELQEQADKATRSSKRNARKQMNCKQPFNTESIVESICSKCRISISGIDNTPKRINQQDQTQSSSSEPEADPSMGLAQKFKSLFSRFVSYTPISSPVRSPSPTSSLHTEGKAEGEEEGNLYVRLDRHRKHWCRFCGTTAGYKWYPGPWGKSTLCYRHSERCKNIDKLDLSCFLHEKERKEPVVRDYCGKCWSRMDVRSASLRCYGCPFSYHVGCVPPNSKMVNGRLFCSEECQHNLDRLGVNVQLPYQAIMPFSQVEVISDKGEVPPISRKPSMEEPLKKRKISFDDEKENSPKKSRSLSAPLVPAFAKKVEIPVPGVIRHSMSAARRYSTMPTPQTSKHHHEELLDEQTYLNRHKRYETMELSSRICRPQILKKLLKQK